MDEEYNQEEMEYRDWRKAPHWYCVKTVFHNNGEMESEIIADEKTGIPIVLQQLEKPLDDVFETANATIYYTYHRGYEKAKCQMEATRV